MHACRLLASCASRSLISAELLQEEEKGPGANVFDLYDVMSFCGCHCTWLAFFSPHTTDISLWVDLHRAIASNKQQLQWLSLWQKADELVLRQSEWERALKTSAFFHIYSHACMLQKLALPSCQCHPSSYARATLCSFTHFHFMWVQVHATHIYIPT